MSFRQSLFKKSFSIRNDQLDIVEENNIPNSKIELIEDKNIRNQCWHSLKIREGANRIFSLSKNLFQKLDAAKAVLVSSMCIENATSNYCNLQLKEDGRKIVSKGQITISGIKIPLVWRSINNELEANGVYVLFCIIKVENEVRETQLLCDIDAMMDDAEFLDVIQINNVNYDSKCIIELYGYAIYPSDIKLKRKISRKAANIQNYKVSHYLISQNDERQNDRSFFRKLGAVELSLDDVSQNEISCYLHDYKFQTDCDIPLFGTLSCKYIMIPMSKIRCLLSEKVQIQFLSREQLKSSEFITCHCELKDRAIHCWKYLDHIKALIDNKENIPLIEKEDVETADYIIPIVKIAKVFYVTLLDSQLCLKVCTYFDDNHNDYQEVLIKNANLELWYKVLSNHINEQDIWKDLFNYEYVEFTPTSFLRHGSVYRASVNQK